MRDAGVPIEALRGARGGHRLPRLRDLEPVALSFDEVAALIASLTALGQRRRGVPSQR